ncbi:MAG: LCP family protein [Candidatus Woykebacteria bacterium]
MRYVDLGVLPYKNKQKSRKNKILKFSILTLFLGIIIYGGYLFYWPISKLIGELIHQPGLVFSLIKNPQGELASTDGRTNVLLLGIDKRSNVPYAYKDYQGVSKKNGFLSDTVIVLSIGKETKDVAMISIPRDTWVDIPSWEGYGGGEGKINSVYSIGNTQEYPGGGLGLIKKVAADKLGITIHYAARIDFEGFKKAVDTLEGIEVDVERSFDDYKYPIEGQEKALCSDRTFSCRFRHVHFDTGVQKMDGEKALAFVRSRTGTNGEGSDFARAARQQRVLMASRSKALSLENLLNPAKINALFRDFGESVETDFSLTLYPAAYSLIKDTNVNSAKKLVFDSSKEGLLYTPNPSSYGGAYVLLPEGGWSKIQSRVKSFLYPPEAPKQ